MTMNSHRTSPDVMDGQGNGTARQVRGPGLVVSDYFLAALICPVLQHGQSRLSYQASHGFGFSLLLGPSGTAC